MKFRQIINSAKYHFKWVEKQCGINGAQLWALYEIDCAPGIRVGDLSAAMAMHPSTVSNLIDRLARSMFVNRHRDSDDRRVVTLSLTKSGESLLKRAPTPARGRLPEALLGLPGITLKSLDNTLAEVLSAMGQPDAGSKQTPLAELLSDK